MGTCDYEQETWAAGNRCVKGGGGQRGYDGRSLPTTRRVSSGTSLCQTGHRLGAYFKEAQLWPLGPYRRCFARLGEGKPGMQVPKVRK